MKSGVDLNFSFIFTRIWGKNEDFSILTSKSKAPASVGMVFLEPRVSYRQFAAASRSGGQKMNRKATAVELRYAPTGTIVWCQDKRTPEQNYELALLNLRKARPISQILARKIRLRNPN